jgi:hypothetical protein
MKKRKIKKTAARNEKYGNKGKEKEQIKPRTHMAHLHLEIQVGERAGEYAPTRPGAERDT